MSEFKSTTGVSMVRVEARIIRRDGRVEDLGAVAYWHRSLLRRVIWRVSRFVSREKSGTVHFGG